MKTIINKIKTFINNQFKLGRRISRHKKELQYNIDINSDKIIILNNELKNIKLLDFPNIADRLNDIEDKLNNNIVDIFNSYNPLISRVEKLEDKLSNHINHIISKVGKLEEKVILANKKIHKRINDDDDNNIILGNEKSRYINVNMCAVDIAKYYDRVFYTKSGDINAEDIKAIEDIIFKHINLTNEGGK